MDVDFISLETIPYTSLHLDLLCENPMVVIDEWDIKIKGDNDFIIIFDVQIMSQSVNNVIAADIRGSF